MAIMAALGGGAAMLVLAAGTELLVDAPARAQERVINPVNVRDPVFQLTRLQMDVFELQCDNERLADLDLDTMARTALTTRDVLGQLNQLGNARILLRYDNTVDLARGTTVRSGRSFPVVSDILVSASDVFTPSVNYQGVGFSAEIAGEWLSDVDPTEARISVRVEVSDHLDEYQNLAEGISLPEFAERLVSEHTRAIKSGQPVLMACNHLQLEPAGGQAVTTVVRLAATRLID
jgi:hypothetical protein